LPLGEVYDNSIMDGTTALGIAEEERKNLKTNTVKNKLNNISDAENEMTANKTAEHHVATNNIYSIYKSISEDNYQIDVNKQESVEKVRVANNQRAEEERKSLLINHSELINTQGYLNEIGIDTGEESAEYQANRVESSLKIEEIRNNSSQVSNDLGVLNYDKTISNSGEIQQINATISMDETAKVFKPSENYEAIKDVRYVVAEKESEKQTTQHFNVISTDQKLIEFEKSYAENDALQIAKQGDNILYVNQLDKKAQLTNVENNYSDEQERLGMRRNVERVNAEVTSKEVAEADKRKLTSAKMDDIIKTVNAESSNIGIGKTESIYTTKQAIDKIENKQPQSVVIANSLGKEYPEGVSQEVFQQKDENGIMKAVLTRRVVVQEGRGDVYVKTETVYATTYTKNGKSTTEYVWQQETNAAGLQRHFK